MKTGYFIFGILCTWLAILNIFFIGYEAHQIPIGIVLLPFGIYWVGRGLKDMGFYICLAPNSRRIKNAYPQKIKN